MTTRYLRSSARLLAGGLTVLLLSSCVKASSNVIPDYPVAGPNVAAELSKSCGGDYLPNCPATAEWLYDLYIFKEQIGVIND